MKISDLKQPYRRMAEYLAEKNTDEEYKNKEILIEAFLWDETDSSFWLSLNRPFYPEITEEIKQYFPPDFNFSGEEQPLQLPNNPIIQNRIYTQLAKEGRFDELPETCEFSEPVELEVWDVPFESNLVSVFGKFHGKFIEKNDRYIQKYAFWNFAQLPTKKIDFTVFKTGDVVEVVRNDNEHIYGLLWQQDEYDLNLTFSDKSDKVKCVLKKDIKSITKIK